MKQITDQALHVLWSAAILAPLVIIDAPWWAILLTGQWFWPRELIDQRPVGQRWPVMISPGKWLDIAFFEAAAVAIAVASIA